MHVHRASKGIVAQYFYNHELVINDDSTDLEADEESRFDQFVDLSAAL